MELRKHVIITGGAKGIGEACARMFVRDGYCTTILDIDKSAGVTLEKELGGQARFIPCDVSKSPEVDVSISQAIDFFGDIDVLVNNAGTNDYSTVTETTDELWDYVMNVNLKSHFLCARRCIPSMQKKGKGVVVNVSSVQAYISQAKVAAYTTAKTALLGLTRSIAVDYSPNIRSVAICPGTIDTPMLQKAIRESPDPAAVLEECNDMHLTKRIGTAEEVAELIVFVSGDKGNFITGQAIRIDGGLGVSVAGSKRDE
ncbi:MAG: SDR family oxidoreductase [Bacteroidetes bacterium]|nr:SDR family oxidoreductase [Bacteroidota bacterium]MDA1119808.1 SDR family oxidoreductase [Bacteroidota bacterium]